MTKRTSSKTPTGTLQLKAFNRASAFMKYASKNHINMYPKLRPAIRNSEKSAYSDFIQCMYQVTDCLRKKNLEACDQIRRVQPVLLTVEKKLLTVEKKKCGGLRSDTPCPARIVDC